MVSGFGAKTLSVAVSSVTFSTLNTVLVPVVPSKVYGASNKVLFAV